MNSTVIDYVGRLVDMLAFRGMFPSSGEQLLAQELVVAGDSGALIAGVEKFAQKFLITLLTEKGSKVLDDKFGTRFMSDARRGGWRTVADVQQSYASARLDAKLQIQQQELSTDPLDERFGDVTLDNVLLDGDKVSIRLTATTLAGSSYTFLTPITVAIM